MSLLIASALLLFAACGGDSAGFAEPTSPPAPSFTLPAAGGGEISLGRLVEQGETVVVFYRGNF